jgi:DNA-nicking Smr family endonuclease
MAGSDSDADVEADRALFRAAMRGVRRLREEPRQLPLPPRPLPRARFTRADRLAVLEESLADLRQPLAPVIETGEELQYRRPGVQEQVFRKLRSGHYRVEAELDLHGLTIPEATAALNAFLAESIFAGQRVLRIVHGKGRRSGHRGPVLKQLVNATLQRIGAVLAFASAREVDGGTGASLVLLSAPRRPR